jgi:hypothetical protein
LNATLERILADSQQLAVPFFEWARKQLLGDKLLQAALRAAECIPAESRIGLPESLAAVGHVVARCEHPAFLAVRDRIRTAWTDGILSSLPVSKIVSTIESSLPQIEQTIDQITSKFNVNDDTLDGLLKDVSLEHSNA